MKKNWLVILLSCWITLPAFSQTLFTYGSYKADAKDFLRAFNKNNAQQPVAGKAKAIREYLDLYINSRLKIQQAYDRRYDTLPQIKSEVENLRNQIIENFLSDPNAVDRLSKEAIRRSLKDIHVAHIFIADNGGDTAAAGKLNEVVKRLARNEDFGLLAQQFSDDPSAKYNKGDLSYITVFTLPYEFENIIYTTPPGKYSKPYHSKTGYHIFKNLGERKALGQIKIQQILLAFPPGSDAAAKQRTARLADSLYQRVIAGDDFGKLATAFSNDMVSSATEGNVPDIRVGQYEPAFEKIIWSLPKDGAISKPFLSEHGYHIVKRVELKRVSATPSQPAMEDIRQKVLTDDRWKTARDFIYNRVRTKASFQKFAYSDAVLWALTDSLLDFKPAGIGSSMSPQSALFKIADSTLRVQDWINFTQMNRYRSDRTGLRAYNSIMEDFVKQTMYQYYRDHLEEFNDDFRNQMNEFRDGNLFFEIMQQEVWNKAQADSIALMALFEKDKSRYNWKQSADAVIFFCSDETTAKTLAEQVRKSPGDWKKISESMNDRVVADSGRYEWQQLPGIGKSVPKAGSVTPLAINTSDNTASFGYIVAVHTQPSPRNFLEAKGLVMNDYQVVLEEQWIKDLNKKYPVVIDQKVLTQISK